MQILGTQMDRGAGKGFGHQGQTDIGRRYHDVHIPDIGAGLGYVRGGVYGFGPGLEHFPVARDQRSACH